MVITGVAESVAQGTIASIVYLDAFLPDDNQSLTDLVPAPMAATSAMVDPVPFPGLGRTGDAHLEGLVTPHPLGTLTEKVRLTGGAIASRSKPMCSQPAGRRQPRSPRWRGEWRRIQGGE